MTDPEDLFGDDGECEAVEKPKDKMVFNNSAIQSSSADGGRTIVATEYMPAGTLVACEWPFITWTDLNFEDAQSVYAVLRNIFDNRPMHLKTLSLYPQQLTPQLLQDEINPLNISKSLIHDVLAINLQAAEIIATDEIYRLVLVLQHNAFDSGLYDYLSMFNHSCLPNCMKFSPSSKSRGASEIWTTKEVQAGEELLISYYHPLEDKIGNIHSYLLQQHHFTCQCTRCIPYLQHAQEEDGKDDVFGHGDGEVYSGMYDAITQAQDALTTIQQQEQDIHTLYIHDQEEDIPIHKVYAHIQALYAYIHCPSPSPLDTLVQGEGEGRYIMVYMAHTLVNLCAKYHELYFQHDEHTHTLQAHPHPHTHILTVHTVWIVSTLYLIRSKTRYAGADHPDYSMHYQDILNSLEVMAGVMRDQQLAFLDYLHTLHQAVAQLGLTIPLSASLPRTYKPPYALSSLLSICQKTYPLLHSICAHSVVEKARLEKMYHLVKRYPDIAFVKKEPGALYLGKA